MRRLEEKIAIITGAGTGIGKGIARAFAAEGAVLVIASRNRRNLESAAVDLRRSGATVLVAPTDVTREAEVVALFEKTMDKFGRVDILVNNAGVADGGPIEELTLETWQHVIDVNLTGAFLCTREAMKVMKNRRGGRIINIGSISAQAPRMHMAPYVASKYGLVGLTRSTALEGREFGISASCLHPGNVAIERRESSDAPQDQEPMMKPDDIAVAALTMAVLPPNVNMLESIVLPVEQLYLGRG